MLHRVESKVNSNDIDMGDEGGGTVLRDGKARALDACTNVEQSAHDIVTTTCVLRMQI